MHKVLSNSTLVLVFLVLLASLTPLGGIAQETDNHLATDTLLTFPEGYTQRSDLASFLQEANEAYRNNDLQKALNGYLYLANQEIHNGFLFYNIGNTYLRLGNLANSILWYERAQLYLPRYKDLSVNLNYARNQIVDEEFLQPNYGSSIDLFLYIHQLLTVRESLILSLLLFWLLIISLIIYFWAPDKIWKPRIRIPCWILGLLFIISILSSGYKMYRFEFVDEAIIMHSAVEIKTAPNQNFSTAFTLHEGTKVIVEQHQGDWVRISMPGNKAFTGWVPEVSLTII